ncbi:MAG: glycosyltransferase, partial [Nitrosopumilales archaeon]|nr:glycosyltransferase [Nitrosopumilales archaeon]
DDSSDDTTADIIKQYAQKSSKIVYVSARKKPDGWIGKNWACMEGYKKATGQLLLFTDSDTKHSQNVLSLAVSHLLSLNLDALTVIPKMLCLDRWTKITLPAISTFLHTRFSALRVNDPAKKTGYFFGSFYLIKNETYRSVGTHEGVKSELIEDGALGKKVKESGFRMRMARGEHLVEAVWARDFDTLWNALKRLIIPLYLQTQGIAVGIFFAILFLLFMPFPFLIYSAILFGSAISVSLLFAVSFLATILIYVAALVETRGLQIKQKYALFWPVGSFIVVCGFLSGILQAKSKSAVSWRGREYAMKDQIQDSISV